MLRREVRKYLYDIAEACDLLEQFTERKTLTDYRRDAMLRSAVERQFEIVGEALKQALNLEPHLSARISHSQLIVAFRNRLIHAYAAISDEVVWGIIEGDLLTLSREVRTLLDEDGPRKADRPAST